MQPPTPVRSLALSLLWTVGVLTACQDPSRPAQPHTAAATVDLGEIAGPPSRPRPDSVTITGGPVRVRDLALAIATPIEIEGAASAANVVLSNSSSRALSSFYWFLDIRQDTSWVEAGWGLVSCGAGAGIVPPGRCPLRGLSFTATHSGRHVGTLMPGPAVLTFELVQQRGERATTVARASIPVSLVASVFTDVVVTPAQYTYFGSPPPGVTVPLSAVVNPPGFPQQVTWTSSQPSVATVDASGVVNVLGEGSALIVATSTLDATKQGSSLFSINTQPVRGNGVIVSPGQWNALRGMKTRLAAQVLSGPLAVTWTSLDPSVATVDASGNVVATGAGSLFVRATSAFDATRSATSTGEVLDYDWRTPSTPTNISTGATLPAANPLSISLGVEACGSPFVFTPPYARAEWEILQNGSWVSVGSTSSVVVIDIGGIRRCWRASIPWTPGTTFGTGQQALRATLYHQFAGSVVTPVNVFVTLTDP